MQVLLIIGRILFVLIFAYAGFQKLMDISGTAALFANRLVIPGSLQATAVTIETTIGMTMPQILAILAGALELAAAIMIAFNTGVRFMAVVLILFTVAGIYYFNDFWNLSGADRDAALNQALLNLSIIGGLLVLAALGSWRPVDPRMQDEF